MIKILEVNSYDLLGKRYNGYDMIEELKKDFDIKQAVIQKDSDNPKVFEMCKNKPSKIILDKFMYYEEPDQSVKSVFSITAPALLKMKEYKEADIVNMHLLHNAGLSLYVLKIIAKEKKLVLTLHDSWMVTGKCVYYFDCDRWKKGCPKCDSLDSFFPFKEDNCHDMWNLKKNIFKDLDVDLVYSTDWMKSNITSSPIFEGQKRLHKIPFGIDAERFQKISREKARKELNISDDEVVLFHRAQNELKGTPYVLEALKNLKTDKKVTVITCENKGLLDEVKDKYRIIDLGIIKDKEMITAMNACDVFLMTSIAESFGLMAIEAMSCSKPVVVFDNSALPSVTHAPECGYLVKNLDSKDLEKAIKKLVEDKEEREKRGKLARKIVEKEYTNEEYYKRLSNLYKEVYKRKKEKVKEEKITLTDNAEQFKFFLNEMTVRLFGTSNKYGKELMYSTKHLKRKKNYKYEYSDLSLQELLFEYEIKLEDIVSNNDDISFDNTIKLKIEKLLYLVFHNPSFIIKKITKK